MKISGLQKLTLLDYPDQVACTVFTWGCNFRCPFCHNASLVVEPEEGPGLPQEELTAFLQKRKGLLDGVCITGGEPLLHPDIGDLIKEIKDLGYLVKLDTNGSFPGRLKALVSAGLIDHVAMDIKNSPESYGKTIGIPDFDLSGVRESVAFLLEGRVPYTFRTTLVRELHTQGDIRSIGIWIKGAERYVLQTFQDSGDLIGTGLHAFSKEESEALLAIAREYIPEAQLRGC